MNEFLYQFVPKAEALNENFILLGVLLFVAFRVFWNGVYPILTNQRVIQWFDRWMPIVESLLWIGFVLYTEAQLINAFPLAAGSVLLVFLIASWFFVKNFVIGLILKIDGKFKIGQWLNVSDKHGEIVKLGKTNIEIRLDKGETLILPFEKFLNDRLVSTNPSDQVKSQSIKLRIPSSIPKHKVMPMLEKHALGLPWSVITRKPIVECLEEGEKSNQYQIVLYAVSSSHFPKMEHQLANTMFNMEA